MRNGMVKGKRVGIAIMAIALAALLLVTACGPAPTVGEKTVEVGYIGPFTGAAAIATQMTGYAIDDYFRYFNEQEAIPGVSIKFLWGDTMMQFAQFLSHYEKFVARDTPLIVSLETTGTLALKERFAKDETVIFGSAAGYEEAIYSPGWRYFICPTPAEQFAAVADYFKENWNEERPPILVFMFFDSPWGYDPVAEGTKYAQSVGYEVLPPEIVPYVPLDTSTQLLRLKEEGADFVYIQGLEVTIAPILRDAERLGLLGQMRFAGNSVGMTEKTIKMSGVASEGFLTPMLFPCFDETDVPGIRLMIDLQMKHRGKVERENTYSCGFVMASVGCEAIKRAIENVGYDNLDGVAIKEALDNMKDFDVNGVGSITYEDPLDHRGITKLAIYEVTGGKLVRVTDWREAHTLVPEGLIRE